MSCNPPTTSLTLPWGSLMLPLTPWAFQNFPWCFMPLLDTHSQVLCMDTHFPDPGSLSILVSDVHMLRSYVSLWLVLFQLAFWYCMCSLLLPQLCIPTWLLDFSSPVKSSYFTPKWLTAVCIIQGMRLFILTKKNVSWTRYLRQFCIEWSESIFVILPQK